MTFIIYNIDGCEGAKALKRTGIDFDMLNSYIYGMTKLEMKTLRKKARAAYEAMLHFPVYDENRFRKINNLPKIPSK
ncbi:hypothetical protein [Fibrobacter sp. UWB10]|jgi:hypothetical protein|uniref:hypothetical protein n=1 Tax=Fibrobacter sp. UWB10 TaxID=1896201 RepID=UPI00156B440E|nr:hypothetical protein [Fibrobacter sp. UWB10]SMP45083.1 hypothetical protein SAMN05720465_1034 [Fibrobacter sp. UWB10]